MFYSNCGHCIYGLEPCQWSLAQTRPLLNFNKAMRLVIALAGYSTN